MRNIVSFLFMFLIVLIIIEKSTKQRNIDQQLFANTEFRNISPKQTQNVSKKILKKKSDDLFLDSGGNIEEEIIQELLETSKKDMENEIEQKDIVEKKTQASSIPIYNIGDSKKEISNEQFENISESEKNDINSQLIHIYFLKFYGNGKKSHSRLIKVQRKVSFDDVEEKINLVLNSLKQGPSQVENSQGILNSIPKSLELTEPYQIQNQILYLSFNSDFEFGAGPEILKDRIDQIAYSLIDNLKIKGIQLAINGKKIEQLGGTGLAIPNIIVKNPRKVVTL